MQIFTANIKQIRSNINVINHYLTVLAEDERDYFNQANSEKRKMQFLVGRFLLRTSLSDILNIAPADIKIIKTTSGKPKLANADLHFSISHSHEMVAIAIDSARVGIDIEFMKERQFDNLAEAAFSHDEAQLIKQAQGAEKKELFYTYWTRKEAAIKYGAGRCNFTTSKYEGEYMLTVAGG